MIARRIGHLMARSHY